MHSDSLPERPSPPRSPIRFAIEWLRWFGIARLIVSAVAVAAVVGAGLWLLRTPPTPVENSLPFAGSQAVELPVDSPVGSSGSTGNSAESTSSVAIEAPPAPIAVYVVGAVVAPGVYTVAADARLQDAVLAAGGLAADADLDQINLAGFVGDGDRVFVPRIGQPVPPVVTPTGGGPATPGTDAVDPGVPLEPIDLNRATADELDRLPGVGPATAAAIVDHRDQQGPFSSVDDLLDVRGIGPAKLDAIRDLIRV